MEKEPGKREQKRRNFFVFLLMGIFLIFFPSFLFAQEEPPSEKPEPSLSLFPFPTFRRGARVLPRAGRPPVAQDDLVSTFVGVPVSFNVLENDVEPDEDPLTARLLSNPIHGMVTLNPDGSATYPPLSDFMGTDSFTYEACDPQETCDTATVTVTVRCMTNQICDDGNVCTDDTCNLEGTCSHAFNTAPCDDGELCTTRDQCISGRCSGTPKNCDDNNPCTNDRCDRNTGGCQHEPKPCPPGQVCDLATGECTRRGEARFQLLADPTRLRVGKGGQAKVVQEG